MKKLILLFFLLSLCELSFAQEQSDRDLITKTVHLYFDGMIERDKEKLEKAGVTNAKLLYTNKALTNDSLNERQKNKLVEAIGNADNIEEAKVIFETLQSTVGSTSRKKQPKSLSEAVQKSSSMILSSRNRKEARQKKDPTLNRWKFLAGIDK